MTDANIAALQQRMLAGYLAIAKAELPAEQFEQIAPALLPRYLRDANDMVTMEVLLDRSIIRQAIDSLATGNSVAETLMYTFMLYVYKLTHASTGHPLEMGIIRQKIIGVLPIFDAARERGEIREQVFADNAAMLMNIADKTADMADTLDLLAAGYQRYA